MGISLAIPIDEALRVVDQLKAHGKVTRGRIGVQITEVADDVAKALGLDKAKGAMVSSVDPDGPAAKAGVHAGDVILNFHGHDIDHMADLPRLVGATQPDTKTSLKVWRKGKVVELKVKVGELTEEQSSRFSQDEGPTTDSTVDRLGLRVQPVPDGDAPGVLVDVSEGAAAESGIEPGDIILRINDTDIRSPKQYAEVVGKLDESRPVVVLVSRDQQSQWVIVKPE